MKKIAMVLCLMLLGSLSVLASTPDIKDLAAKYGFDLKGNKEVLAGPKEVTLAGGMEAQTVVLRYTTWEMKSLPQSAAVGQEKWQEAMKLPERERLKLMNRYDEDTQIWWVELKEHPNAGAALKSGLKVEAVTNRYHCELAWLGKGRGQAWFAYMPIGEWILMQREMRLEGGEDPLAAAVRGLSIKDYGTMTIGTCSGILTEAGTKAIPYIKPLLDLTNTYRLALGILAGIPGPEVSQLLRPYGDSPDRATAEAARYLLAFYPHPELKDDYFRWLEQEIGRSSNVLELLNACAKYNKARLAPLLPKIMAASGTIHEYRRACQLSREIAGHAIPKPMRDLEETIKRYGYKSGPNYNQEKVDAATADLLKSKDTDALACIGFSLAVAVTKGDYDPVNKAGVRILKSLPEGHGVEFARQMAKSLRDEWTRNRLEKLLSE